jgi:hypothetical protein
MRIYSASRLRTKWRSLLRRAWFLVLYLERWLALQSQAERLEKWRMTLRPPIGHPAASVWRWVEVSFNILDPVTISPDGKSVAVTGLDGKVMLYPVDEGDPRTVPKLADGFAPLRWCRATR